MVNTVVVRPTIQQTFERFLQQERVLFFSAPCGFGKTTVARELAGEKGVLYLTAETPDFSMPAEDGIWQMLAVDDAQQMTGEECQTLCHLIRTCPGRRFMILSRGAVPGCMMAFQYAGIMTVLEAEALLFDREDIRRLFQGEGIALTEGTVSGILKESIGYPLGVAVTARCMAGGQPFEQKLVSRAFREVFRYFETAVYQRFELPLRRFLLELAPFDSFDLEMARMVSGNPRAGSCWTGCSTAPRCCAMTALRGFISSRNSGLFCNGKWNGSTRRSSRRRALNGAGCITNCGRSMCRRWTAIPGAATTPRCRSCWGARQNCTPGWDTTARWKNITAVCLRERC